MEPAHLAEYAILAVVGIVTVVLVAAFSKKLGVAAPLILVVLGVGGSYLPGLEHFQVPPELILFVLLPPLLYAAAINVPIVDFRRNLSTISALSVALVIATAFGTGFLLFLIFPRLDFAAAVALGAVISPTDVVAATSIGKRLGLPPRLVTILEGEGLVNDATALVLLRSAIAVTAAAVSFWGVVGDFAYAASVAIAIGLVIGFVTVFLRSKLHDPVLDTAISFAVPFIAFIPAEELHASGVLAVVVAGLYSGHSSANRFTPQARISERLNWRTAQFVIENGVFLLMGLQIHDIVTQVDEHPDNFPVAVAVLVGLLMTAAVVVVRFVFVGPLLYSFRRRVERQHRASRRFASALARLRHRSTQDERAERRRGRAERMLARRQADVQQLTAEGFGWRGGLILSWSGMRGVVTLAAAQSLPATDDFPYRPQLVLIAFTVAIATLLLQGGTLPALIRLTGIRGADRTADRRELATLLDEMSAAGLGLLENPDLTLPDGSPVNDDVLDHVRRDTMLTAEVAWERAENGVGPEALSDSPHQQYRALRRQVLAAERDALLEARAEGTYPSRILFRAEAMLDLEETRLEQIDSGGRTES